MAEKTIKTAPKAPKVFDVSKPGKTGTASATAKPVIVGNRPIIQDPMVTPSTAPEVATATSTKTTTTRMVIKPISPDDAPEETAPASKTTPSFAVPGLPIADVEQVAAETADDSSEDTAAVSPEPLAATDDATADEPEVPATPAASKSSGMKRIEPLASNTSESAPDTDTSDSDDAEVDADLGDEADRQNLGGIPLAKGQAANEEEIKRQAELEQLIEEKKYFLPINTIESRRSHMVVVTGVVVSLILALLLLVLLLDVGVVTIPGIKPVTNFL